MKKKRALPSAYAELTKDMRYEGTFEVFVPVPNRSKAHRVPLQFETQAKAEAWIHGPEGSDAIAQILREAAEK